MSQCVVASISIMLVGAFTVLVISSLIVNDYVETTKFSSEVCRHTDIPGYTETWGMLECVQFVYYAVYYNEETNHFDLPVTLLYPYGHWQLMCRKESDYQNRNTIFPDEPQFSRNFSCLVKEPGNNSSIGSPRVFDSIDGWIATLTSSVLILIMGIILLTWCFFRGRLSSSNNNSIYSEIR